MGTHPIFEADFDCLTGMGLNGNKFPWYRERLRNKYSKDVNPILNHKNWTFVKNGLDDFRDGMPPDPGHDWVVRPKRGPEPALLTGKKEPARPKLSAPRSDLTRKLNSEELYYSKQIPAADRRRRRVKELEANLLGHPLALFPTLENGLSPELYEEIVDILEPDLLDMSDSETEESPSSVEPVLPPINAKVQNSEKDIEEPEKERAIAYEKLFRKKRTPTDNIKTLELERHERKIKQIAKDFIDWSKVLGEDGPELSEDTIQALFASGYSQSKETASVNVVELSSVPPELRAQAGLPPVPVEPVQPKNQDQTIKAPQKYRYGAWYLKPELWKRLATNEPMIDPEELTRQENNEANRASHELHQELAALHGAKAYRKYLETSGVKKPEFMKAIGKIQDEELQKDQ